MSETTPAYLVLRFRRANSPAPTYRVEATLNHTSSVSAAMDLSLEEMRSLESEQWDYGRRLGERAFSDVNLRSALAFVRGSGNGCVPISIEIDPDAPELHDLLWERLILPGGNQETALAADVQFALARRVLLDQPVNLTGDGVFRLLVVIASPVELADTTEDNPLHAIDVGSEIGNLRQTWDDLVQRGLMHVRIMARMDDRLQAELRQARYDVAASATSLDAISGALSGFDSLHLICHGSFKRGVASLLLEDAGGHNAIVAEDQFLPRLGTGSLRLVFLQSCKSAQRQAGSPNVFSGLAPKVARHAGAVLAMQDYVRMEDASRFAREFYKTLLETGSPARAANAGRRVLLRPGSVDWAIPALYLAPGADRIWEPDAALTASLDLAQRFRLRPEVAAAFPIEVVRHTKDISLKLETSPPGPRMKASDAVKQLLFPAAGPRVNTLVIAGNYGRGKTSVLRRLYTEYAADVSAGGPLPLFVGAADFEISDLPPADAAARAIARTYARELDITVGAAAFRARLDADFIVFADAPDDIDRRKLTAAFETLAALVEGCNFGSVVVTAETYSLANVDVLCSRNGQAPEILLVQVMSPAAVAQYLQDPKNLPADVGARLLDSIRSNNMFDFAGVPWLLTCLMRQAGRKVLSRTSIVSRIVDNNLLNVGGGPGAVRMVSDALGRIAWTMQTTQSPWISGGQLYEILGEVRGQREISLNELRQAALGTSLVCQCDEDSLRFAYPGFQSYWCAQYLMGLGSGLWPALDDITATLGRRSRVQLWEDTLMLLCGLLDEPDQLLRRIAAGSSVQEGQQLFLASICIQEARLNGRTISDEVICHVQDGLVWRSTAAKERDPGVRIRAIECLGLLGGVGAIPHLFGLAFEPIRRDRGQEAAFEFSGIRQAAVLVLLNMEDAATKYLVQRMKEPGHPSSIEKLPDLLKSWRGMNSADVQNLFLSSGDGIPAIAAFALGALGDANLDFLAAQLQRPETANDTAWAIAEALLELSPVEVTRKAVRPLYSRPEMGSLAAYLIGKLRIAEPGNAEFAFLCCQLQSAEAKTQGMSLRALAQLGDSTRRNLCEALVLGDWEGAGQIGLAVPEASYDRATLRYYALDALRLIGTPESAERLRLARHRPGPDWPDNFVNMSYEVSEDIFQRCAAVAEQPGPALPKELACRRPS
jgi:hypothetical protein